MEDECCLNNCFCERCFNNNCCNAICSDPATGRKKTPEEERQEQRTLERLMRIGVYTGYTFALIGVFTQDHFMWRYPMFWIVFFGLYISSLWAYEALRTSNPGFIQPKSPSKKDANVLPTPTNERKSSSEGLKKRNGHAHMDDFNEPVAKSVLIEDPSEEGVSVKRQKFCKKCEKFVAKYDHHCYWLGTCIGERNHVLFVSFLMFECAFLIYCWILSIHAMWLAHYDIIHTFTWMKLLTSLAIVWLAFFVSISIFFFPFCLLCHHCYLIATNQTSYEVYRPFKLDYLKNVQDNAAKFDEGVIRNCFRFWIDQNPLFKKNKEEGIDWRLKTRKGDSFLVNFDDYCERFIAAWC
jgi:palmitoyltransferase